MDYRKFDNTYVVRIDKDEEILEKVEELALKENITLAHVSALGAVKEFTIGVFKTDTKQYIANDFIGCYEIVSLTGTINTMNGEFYTHLHMCVGDEKGNAFGGHLNSATVSATCEMILRLIDGTVDRKKDPETGLNLFRFD